MHACGSNPKKGGGAERQAGMNKESSSTPDRARSMLRHCTRPQSLKQALPSAPETKATEPPATLQKPTSRPNSSWSAV